jgi:hypothetical protein
MAEHRPLGSFQDDDAARQAAHKKAREWLDFRKDKPPQQPSSSRTALGPRGVSAAGSQKGVSDH